jgi:hypothetical protein
VKVSFGKHSHLVPDFSTYEELMSAIYLVDSWKKPLFFYYFELFQKISPKQLKLITAGSPLPESLSHIVIKLKSKGFSNFKHCKEAALEHIRLLFSDIKRYLNVRQDDEFPDTVKLRMDEMEDGNYDISKEDMDRIMDHAFNDIVAKLEVISLSLATEYTIREFISPILIASLRLGVRYLANHKYDNMLTLVCEKVIVGLLAHGPVDYIMMMDYFDMVLTEAKKQDLEYGLVQNLLQQYSSLEYLSNVVNASEANYLEKKRKAAELMNSLSTTLTTYGIVSTGKEWIFSKCIVVTVNNESYNTVALSSTLELPLNNRIAIESSNEVESLKVVLRKSMERIVLIIFNILKKQISVVRENALVKEKLMPFLKPQDLMSLAASQAQALSDNIHDLMQDEEEELDAGDYNHENDDVDEEDDDDE